MVKMPTQKQLNRIDKILNHQRGENQVKDYFYKHFPDGDYEHMTREQAQKIITGLAYLVSTKPIYGVAGSDVRW